MKLILVLISCVSLLFPPALIQQTDTTESFYADTAKVGDVYAGMTLTSIDFNLDTNNVTAQFEGEATLTGTFERIPEDNEFFSGIFFSVDEESVTKLPKLATDEREETGFIFSNEDDSQMLALFGNPAYGEKGKAIVVIKDYRINHQHKEITDTAKLVKVINVQTILPTRSYATPELISYTFRGK